MTDEEDMEQKTPTDAIHRARGRGEKPDIDTRTGAAAARVVAAAMDRGDDELYVSYLTGLSDIASKSQHQQQAGVARLTALLDHPDHQAKAQATLEDFIQAAEQGFPSSARAVAAARTAVRDTSILAQNHQHPDTGAQRRSPRPPLRTGLRMLGQAIRVETGASAVAIIGGIMFGLLTVAIAGLLNVVVGRVWPAMMDSGHFDGTTTTTTVVACLVIFAGRGGGLLAQRVGARVARLRLQTAYQRTMLDRLRSLPATWHQRQSPHELVSAADVAVRAAWRPLTPLPAAAGGVAMLLVATVALWALDWRFAIIGAVSLILLCALYLLFLRVVTPHVELAKSLRDEIYDITRRTFGSQGADPNQPARGPLSAFTATSAQLRDVMIQIRRIRGAFIPALAAIPPLGSLVALSVAATSLRDATTTAADLASTAFLLAALSAPIVAVGSVLAEIPRGVREWQRLHRVLATGTEAGYGPASLQGRAPAAVRFERVDVTSEDGRAMLRDATFNLPAGRVTAIVGWSRADASVIGLLAARMRDPDNGRVLVSGRDLRTVTRESLASGLAYVVPTRHAGSGSVREIITRERPYVNEETVWRALRAVRHERVVAHLPRGLDTPLTSRLRRRLGAPLLVARALAGQPRLLVIDSAAEGYPDPETISAIRSTWDVTILLVAPTVDLAAACDLVIYVDQDGTVRTGGHSTLLATEPSYARLVEQRRIPSRPAYSCGRNRGVPVDSGYGVADPAFANWLPRHGHIEDLAAACAYAWFTDRETQPARIREAGAR